MISEQQDKKRMNVEDDRLSSLSDDLIHKIFSLIGTKKAIEMSTLSSRWRFVWTSIPYLDFSTKDFRKLPKFSKFVTNVLTRRDNQIDVSSVDLSFRGKANQTFVKKITKYAISHNVQKLSVTSFLDKTIEFPLSLFSSQSLKHLSLTGYCNAYFITLTSTWDLPAITTLYLKSIASYDESVDLFSNCPNLKNLTLHFCRTRGRNGFIIRHSQLSNLTLKSIDCNVNVEAPQLKNLIVRQYDLFHSLQFSADAVHSLEKADLRISHPNEAHKIVAMFQRFHGVKFLTLNLEIVELLSSYEELISHQPSPFANLKILKIYPVKELSENESPKKVSMSSEAKNYMLGGSPDTIFTMISREEIRAQKLMGDLEVLLDQWKAEDDTDTDTDTTQTEQGEVENEMQLHFGERMTRMETYWEDLNDQVEEGKSRARDIMSMLRDIENLLTNVPTPQRVKLQTTFSSLCAKADSFIDFMMECMKIQCDKKPSRLNFNIHELATTSQSSS